MNDDHQESCEMLVRAFTEHSTATKVRMTGLDTDGLEFSITDEHQQPSLARVPFEKPVRHAKQVRGLIVSLSRKARETLSEG
jgi:putative heme iron utilization protein